MDADSTAHLMTWLATTTNHERFDFIRQVINCCPFPETSGLLRLVENSRKRKKNAEAPEKRKKQKQQEVKSNVPASFKVPVSSASAGVPVSLKVPVSLALQPWFLSYLEDLIVAIDCEMVAMKAKVNGKHPMKAASVAIVRKSDLKCLYKTWIYRESGSFKVNANTIAINGIKSENFLEVGKPLQEVQEEVDQLLTGKLVITVNGFADFEALDMKIGDYDIFDLRTHWKKWNGAYTKAGDPVMQPIGLRSLYFHYYGKDIQKGVHTAEADARATLEMFEKYKCQDHQRIIAST